MAVDGVDVEVADRDLVGDADHLRQRLGDAAHDVPAEASTSSSASAAISEGLRSWSV
jgi:hypothetical protein